MKSRIKKILALVFAALFLFSGWQLYRIRHTRGEAEEQYESLEQYVSVPSPTPPAVPPETPRPEETAPSAAPSVPATPPDEEPDEQETVPVPEPAPQVDFEELYKINPDVVGWLLVEGTQINYPVVQGEDDSFYLKHQFDGRFSEVGCLFLDAENDASFQETNQIIYGHYRWNGAMFYDVGEYKNQSFFDEHPTGWLITPSAAYRLYFFAGYVSDVHGNAWDIGLAGDEYLAWLEECKERSAFSSDITPAADSCVLTLSTCSYEFKNARFVLHAVLEMQGSATIADS